MNKKRVVIVGSGISGLATAALLAKNGFSVTVLEKNSFLGGRASIYSKDGYIFDKGPSWYMMPEVFDNYFSIFNKKTSDFYRLKKLKVHYKVLFDSKQHYAITDDTNATIQMFEQVEKGAGARLKKYLSKSKYIYENAMRDLVMLDYTSTLQVLKPSLLQNLFRLNLFTNLHTYVGRFFSNKDLQKILEFTTVFLGGSPYNTPAFYSLVTHADFNSGIYYPLGGMHKIIKGLVRLCEEYRVRILNKHEVTEIAVDQGYATQVKAGQKWFTTDYVVSSMDYRNFEVNLVPDKYQTYPKEYWDNKTLSPGALIIHLGIQKKLNNVEHHNLYFHNSWEHHFKTVFEQKKWPENPSYYVHMPSKTDPGIAPAGCEALMFLVPVAPGLSDDSQTREHFSRKIISHFEHLTGETISPFIKVRRIFSHRDFIQEYNAFLGSAFGLAHTLGQTAIFRPKSRSKRIKNLFYTGQYTNPGVGVPICLLSAQITRNLINTIHG